MGQEKHALEVGIDNEVVAFLGGFQEIGPHLGGDPGVIDQQVDTASGGRLCGGDDGGTSLGRADIATSVGNLHTEGAEFFKRCGD